MPRKRRSWLRRLIWAATGGLVVLVGLYVHLTRPARLRAQVLRELTSRSGLEVTLGHVTFSPWGGLELIDLAFAPASTNCTVTGARGAGPPSSLRVADARIRCGLLALLTGEVQPRDVTLDGVEVRVVQDPGAEAGEAGPHAAGRYQAWNLVELTPSKWPRVRLEQADVQWLAAEKDGVRLVRRWLVSGAAGPTPDGYEGRLVRLGNSPAPLAEIRWDRASGEAQATLDWLDVELAGLFMPDALGKLVRELDLRGQIRVDRAVLAVPSAAAGSSAAAWSGKFAWRAGTVRLAGVRGSIPVEEPDGAGAPWPAARRFLQVREGEIALRAESAPLAGAGLVRASGTARLNGSPVEFDLTVPASTLATPERVADEVVAAEVRVAGLAFPAREQNPAFVTSRRLPKALREFFNEYRPAGRINLQWRARRVAAETGVAAGAGSPLSVAGEVEALGGRCRYHKFPYEFEDARGWLRISDSGIRFDGLTGRHGSAAVRADGAVHHSGPGAGFEVVFRATNIALDSDLFAALPGEYQGLWLRAAPLGACDAVVTVRREETPPGQEFPTEVRVDAGWLCGSLLVGPGERLHATQGTFEIAHGVVTLCDLQGYLDGAAVRMAGTISVDGNQTLTDLHVQAADALIRQSVALDADQAGGAVRLTGRGDVWGHLRGATLEGAGTADYAVHLKDGILNGFDPTQVWEQCQGWIRVVKDRHDVLSFAARQGDASLQGTASLTTASPVPQAAAFDIRVADGTLEHLVPQIVPRRWADVGQRLGLAGRGSVRLRMQPRGDVRELSAAPVTNAPRAGQAGQTGASGAATGPSTRPAVDVHLTAERMKPAAWPLDLRAVEARARVSDEDFELLEALASYGPEARLRADGRLEWTDGKPRGEFRLRAERVDISPDLLAAMPAPASRLFQRLAPKGRLRLDLDQLRIADDQGSTWDLAGRLAIEAGELDLGLPLTEFDGELNGRCTVRAAGDVELNTALRLERGQLAGRPIERWEGRLQHEAGEPWVRLEALRGRLCGGDALGFIRIDPDSSAYELSLTLQDVAFAQLLPPRQPQNEAARRGRLEGYLFLRGHAGDASSRVGGGNLRIRGASFLQTPVLAQVAEARRQGDQQVDDSLDLVELRFLWHGSGLQLTRLDIQSRDLRLVGEGTWDMDSDAVDLTLVGAHPRHWPRVTVLTDVLESAGQELVQYRVQGTVAAPRVTVEPLHKLTATLRALLGSGP